MKVLDWTIFLKPKIEEKQQILHKKTIKVFNFSPLFLIFLIEHYEELSKFKGKIYVFNS